MGGTIACLAVLENQENLSGLILESAAIEMHPKTASWTVRTAAKILSKEGFYGQPGVRTCFEHGGWHKCGP